MSIRTKITPNGNLLTTADNESRRELAEQFALGGYHRTEMLVQEAISPNSELMFVPPEAIGALTEAPIIGEADYVDGGDIDVWGRVWWYPEYQVSDPWEELRRRGRVIFTLAPADEPEPEPRPLDAVAARVVAEMAAGRVDVRVVAQSVISAICGRSMAAFVFTGKGC